MDRATFAIAGNGMCAAVGAAALLPSLTRQSGVIDGAVHHVEELDVVAVLLVVAVATFFSALTVIFGHLRRNGGGVGGRRNLEVMFFGLCASVGVVVDIFLFLQPGAGELVVTQAQLTGAAAVLLPPVSAATFLLSTALMYVHVLTGGGGGAGGHQNPAAVELVSEITLGATLLTAVLTVIMVGLTFNTE